MNDIMEDLALKSSFSGFSCPRYVRISTSSILSAGEKREREKKDFTTKWLAAAASAAVRTKMVRIVRVRKPGW